MIFQPVYSRICGSIILYLKKYSPIFLSLFFAVSELCSGEAVSRNAIADIPVSGKNITEGVLGLDDVEPMVQKLLEGHISKHSMTEEIVIRAHELFFLDFDRSQSYLLAKEVLPYTSSLHAAEYLKEWQDENFSSFRDMLGVIQDSILRARKERSLFFSSTKSLQAFEKALQSANAGQMEKTWPQTLYEQNRRQIACIVRKVFQRLQQIQEDKKLYTDALLSEAIKSIESEVCQEEDTWLLVDQKSQKRLPISAIEKFLAEQIMKAYGASLDAHSAVLSAHEAQKLKERLSKEIYGTGIVFDVQKGNRLYIKQIQEGSPASCIDPKISLGDCIIAIDGKSIESLVRDGVDLEQLLGDDQEHPSMECVIVSSRDGKKRAVEITKKFFMAQDGRLDVQQFTVHGKDIYVLKLHSFYMSSDETVSSEKDIRRAIEDIKKNMLLTKRPCLGIILDLRDNRGGYVLQAVNVAGLFIRTGVIVVARYADGTQKALRDINKDQIYSGPMVVLTSKMTASAAEIVAQALQGYGVALIVGDKTTFGKGSIQMQTATNEGASKEKSSLEQYFKVTVGQYYAVSGESIQKSGVHADVVVPSVWVYQNIGEASLDTALPQGDPIAAHFVDTLDDVPLCERSSLQKEYLPTLQKPLTYLNAYIPELRQRSRLRISRSPNWQAFLQKNYALFRSYGTSDQSIEAQVADMQRDEAIQVLQDVAELSHKTASF